MTKGNTRAGFDTNLRMFQKWESALAMRLMPCGTNTIKHKRDFGTLRAGNLFVGYRQPSSPSSIATTTADAWTLEAGQLLLPKVTS